MHAPLAQPAVPLTAGHGVHDAPQLAVLVSETHWPLHTCVAAGQVMPHWPLAQVEVPPLAVGQGVQDAPQVATAESETQLPAHA